MINLRLTLNQLRRLIPILVFVLTACTHIDEPEKSVLNLEVGIDYQYGGVQPVVRQEFYLLDTDLNEMLGGSAGESPRRLWELTSFVDGSWGQEAEKKRADLTEIIRAHTNSKGDYGLAREVIVRSYCSTRLLYSRVVNNANRTPASYMELSSGS